MANNGHYRCKEVTINKYDGVDLVVGYPHVYNMLDVGYDYDGLALTDEIISNMLDGAVGDSGTWNDLLDDFKTWVMTQEVNLNIQSDQLNIAYGVDTITCPISYGDYF